MSLKNSHRLPRPTEDSADQNKSRSVLSGLRKLTSKKRKKDNRDYTAAEIEETDPESFIREDDLVSISSHHSSLDEDSRAESKDLSSNGGSSEKPRKQVQFDKEGSITAEETGPESFIREDDLVSISSHHSSLDEDSRAESKDSNSNGGSLEESRKQVRFDNQVTEYKASETSEILRENLYTTHFSGVDKAIRAFEIGQEYLEKAMQLTRFSKERLAQSHLQYEIKDAVGEVALKNAQKREMLEIDISKYLTDTQITELAIAEAVRLSEMDSYPYLKGPTEVYQAKKQKIEQALED